PTNQRPAVNAGPDQTVATHSTTLNGSGTDDGLPNPPATLTYTWSKVNGPGTVSFGNAHAATTAASFSAAGVYTLQLAASDSVFVSTDTVTISVNPDPTPRADLKVTVSDSKATVFAGQKDTYIIVVTNVGPNSANGAAVIDSFPAFFTGVTFTATQTGEATGFTASGSGNIN